MTSKEYICNIITSRGQWTIPLDSEGNELPYENHHILPRCKGGEPFKCDHDTKHQNLIWLTFREHFEIHKLLADGNPDDFGLQQAYFMLARYGSEIINADEYAELRTRRLQVLSSEEFRQLISDRVKGKKWFNDGEKSIMAYDCPCGFTPGRCQSDIESMKNDGRDRGENCRGRHFYNNGDIQVMAYECPEGFVPGGLPMSIEAKLAHQVASKNSEKMKQRKNNRGYETLYAFSNRVDKQKFLQCLLDLNFTDEQLQIQFNATIGIIMKYRRLIGYGRSRTGRLLNNHAD